MTSRRTAKPTPEETTPEETTPEETTPEETTTEETTPEETPVVIHSFDTDDLSTISTEDLNSDRAHIADALDRLNGKLSEILSELRVRSTPEGWE